MNLVFRSTFSALFLLASTWTITSCTLDPQQPISPSRAKAARIETLPVITMDQFIGANAFVDDRLSEMKAVGFIREYHNWNWDESGIWSDGGDRSYTGYPDNKIKWAPSYAGPSPGWNFDNVYQSMTTPGPNPGEGNLMISPCIKENVPWIHGTTNLNNTHDKPVDQPDSRADSPYSYYKKAHHMYQFAARYGSSAVDLTKLTLADDQLRTSGLGRIKYIEDWNEPDNDWSGPKAYFTPEEYAAMASANYDGHGRTMTGGTGTFGVKNADPNIKLVMGGLAFLDGGSTNPVTNAPRLSALERISRMKTWFDNNRGPLRASNPDIEAFPLDVINLHHYAWKDPMRFMQGGGPAISPENAGFKGKLERIVDYRNKNLPGVEVWVSEFGWDTSPTSPLRTPRIGNNDQQEVQGQWLVRAYLAFAAAGVDRAQMYMLRDVDSRSSTSYASCGLVGPYGSWTPKKSWYYVGTMKNTLTGMVFKGDVSETINSAPNKNVSVYKFGLPSADNSKEIYAVWCNTSTNAKVSNYQIKLANKPASVSKIEMVAPDNTLKGKSSSITPNTTISVNVTERPIFIMVNY